MVRSGRRRRVRPPFHDWVDDACRQCGLTRREEWIVDDEQRPVMALVWSADSRDVCVRPFPPMLGLAPPTDPLWTLEGTFGDLTVAGEPSCPVLDGPRAS